MTSKDSGDYLHGLAALNIPPFGLEVHQTAEQRTRTGAQITKRIAAASQVRHGKFSFLFKAKRHGSHCLIFRPTGMGSSVPSQRHSLRASAPLCLPVSAIVSIFAAWCAYQQISPGESQLGCILQSCLLGCSRSVLTVLTTQRCS